MPLWVVQAMNSIESLAFILCLYAMGFFAHRVWRLRKADVRDTNGLDLDMEKSSATVFPLRRWLRTLGADIPSVWLIGCVLMLLLFSFALMTNFLSDYLVLAGVASLCLIALLLFMIEDAANTRIRKIEASLVNSMYNIRACLNTRIPPAKAIHLAARVAKGPIKAELQEISDRLALGFSAPQALSRLMRRYDCRSVRLFAQALIARYESDTDLAFMFDNISKLMAEQIQERLMMTGQLSGAKYTAVFSGLLPYLLIPFLLRQDPQWFTVLLESTQGIYILTSAVVLQILGFLWLRQIIRGSV